MVKKTQMVPKGNRMQQLKSLYKKIMYSTTDQPRYKDKTV